MIREAAGSTDRLVDGQRTTGAHIMWETRAIHEQYRRTQAAHVAREMYRRVRSKARWGNLWASLTGNSRCLLDLEAVEAQCRVRSRCDDGLRAVPIRQIRGSEGRSQDFDASFHPIQRHTRDRWVGIASALYMRKTLPPVKLIQIGDLYFVRDGHHRISVAQAMGQEAIEAEVTAWTVVGPLPWERRAESNLPPPLIGRLASRPA